MTVPTTQAIARLEAEITQSRCNLAAKNLEDHQRQLDADGVEVGVSRQAVDETLAQLTRLEDAAAELARLFLSHTASLTQGSLGDGTSLRDITEAEVEAVVRKYHHAMKGQPWQHRISAMREAIVALQVGRKEGSSLANPEAIYSLHQASVAILRYREWAQKAAPLVTAATALAEKWQTRGQQIDSDDFFAAINEVWEVVAIYHGWPHAKPPVAPSPPVPQGDLGDEASLRDITEAELRGAVPANILARLIAENLGFSIDDALRDKSEWNALRGRKGDRFHDINEPYQTDYLEAAKAVQAFYRAMLAAAPSPPDLNAVPQPGSGWLPIESAPRVGGMPVDLWSAERGERIADAWWSGTAKLRKNEEHRWHAANQDYHGESGWIGNGLRITHWRPLPDPPHPATQEHNGHG